MCGFYRKICNLILKQNLTKLKLFIAQQNIGILIRKHTRQIFVFCSNRVCIIIKKSIYLAVGYFQNVVLLFVGPCIDYLLVFDI